MAEEGQKGQMQDTKAGHGADDCLFIYSYIEAPQILRPLH